MYVGNINNKILTLKRFFLTKFYRKVASLDKIFMCEFKNNGQ